MKILLITQYFKPEPGAGTARIYFYAKYLKKIGHQVSVLCGVPNYPSGEISAGYRNKFFQKEDMEGITVYRTLVYPTLYSSNLRRLLNYSIFTVSSCLAGLFFMQKHDVIIASSPPPSAGITSLVLSNIKRVPLIFEVRDVWPGAARALGYLKNTLLLKVNLFFEKRIYRRASYVISPTEDTKNLILRDNPFLSKDKVRVITNGVDLETFDSVKPDSTIRKKLGLEGKFVIVYTGTLGLQQGVASLVECAKMLNKNSQVAFLIIGEGAEKVLIEEAIEKDKLTNVILKDVMPYNEVVKYIKAADVGLTVLKENKYLNAAYPVKSFDYMAGEKPVLVSGGLAMKQLVEDDKIGFWTPAEEPKILLDTIVKISKMPPVQLAHMGQRGRKLVENIFNREKQAKGLERILTQVVKHK